MKRLCLILAFLFLFTQTAFAMPLLIGQKVVYRGTITGLRISAVDGTAFIDNLPYTYQSDFSAGENGWTADGGAVAGNIDDIPDGAGEDDVLRFTVNTANSQHIARKLSIITVGKKYNVTFKYYLPSTNSILTKIVLFASAGWSTTTTLTTQDSWTTVTVATTATATGLYWYGANSASSFTFQDAGGDDVFYIKDVTISEIQPYMDGNHQIEIYDASNRMLRGVLKAATSSETLGAEINSGTLTVLTLYKITATEVNHFGTGLVVGSYFTSAGTETCDANNKVQQITAGALGATIVSAKGGTTYNFSYKNPSFTYNSSSYYCIIKLLR